MASICSSRSAVTACSKVAKRTAGILTRVAYVSPVVPIATPTREVMSSVGLFTNGCS